MRDSGLSRSQLDSEQQTPAQQHAIKAIGHNNSPSACRPGNRLSGRGFNVLAEPSKSAELKQRGAIIDLEVMAIRLAQTPVAHLDFLEARAFHRRLKAAPYRFDFGKFGHSHLILRSPRSGRLEGWGTRHGSRRRFAPPHHEG
jgi:hypothetical protein